MADTVALTHLYETVKAAYLAESDLTPHFFGWEEPPKQLRTRTRIVWAPGDESGSVGEILPPRMHTLSATVDDESFAARPLANLSESFRVYINGTAAGQPRTNEAAHYAVTRLLFDTWYRHIYNAAHGNVSVRSLQWSPSSQPQEFRYGASLLVTGAILSVIPDAQDGVVSPLNALIDLTLLDVTEPVTVDNGAVP